MRRQTVTIKHVAAEAGVSLQTVSRVINKEPHVRPAVLERVEAAVAKLGYVPSLAARRMGGSRSYLILALNDRDRTIEGWQSDGGTDWVDQMLLGGMLKCAEHGYRMIFELVDTHAAHVEREISAAISSLHPDGIILTPPHGDNPVITDLLTRLRVPFARIGSAGEGAGFSIAMDEAAAAAAATDHLVQLGHSRIGFVTGSDEYALSVTRLEGWRRAMAAAGLAAGDDLVRHGDFTFRSGAAAAETLVSGPQPVTAIVASNDQMALAALHVAQDRGLAVPGDLSIISFDDTPITRFSVPPLTAIAQPIAAMASRAAELLIEARGQPAETAEASVLPFRLVARASTGPVRADG
ncbi:LacI family transcriptional regulator [Sphingomonas jejuensis]|uniref:LacI family transcriptional regulator n=2 Tax=Sphingomonas jejuensis TaxID=904715 RepID=A0ABX0XII5_9SPHN|nr:LacI family transcriptional regulator [Sphingomonas jejuensis]